MKKGMIYSAGGGGGAAEIGKAVRWLKLAAETLRTAGLVCMGLAALGLVFIYVPLITAEIHYAWTQTSTGKEFNRVGRNLAIVKIEEKPKVITAAVQPNWPVPDDNYSIYIPKIEAISRVIPDVSVENRADYMAALQKGVAEASGLAHPGKNGTTYLFAHSVGNRIDYARYNAVFYLLDKLDIGDAVEIVYNKTDYKYQVWNKEILEPSDVHYLLPQYTEEKLILQTCYPPGTTWKRLVITARRV